jgi:hypothetical protein
MFNKTMPKFGESLSATGAAVLVLVFVMCSLLTAARADDGIWLWNQLPKELSAPAGATGATGTPGATGKPRRPVDVTQAFADDLRLATVRLNNGSGSGSFVSANGPLLTNQHLVGSCIAKVGGKDHDYTADGFYASAQSAEVACPGFEASVLLGMEDVTVQVKGAAAVKSDDTAKGLAKELAASRWCFASATPISRKSKANAPRRQATSAAWSASSPAAATIFIGTNATPIFVWCSRRNIPWPSSAASATAEQARAVHVATQGITEALSFVYKAKPLLQELGVKAPAI